ncbi:MAG TPA: urea ABC transporter permease subunit UrtB [Methylosinus sp.]|jgi:urea transport system permease protein|uniref:urea ABC transporter permease subunit UrtB n=1 Tax=Methylosinus sp. TaxID=427 RepID=UPI002F92529C
MLRLLAGLMLLAMSAAPAMALDRGGIAQLTGGDPDEQRKALDAAAAQGDLSAIPFLRDLLADRVKLAGDAALIVDGDKVVDALDRTPAERPADAEDVSTSNSLRLAIEETIALLELASPDRALRLEAVKRLQNAEFDEPRLALLAKAEQKERDAGVRDTLRQMRALGELQSPDRALRLSAAQALRTTISGRVREALKTRLATEEDGELRVALTRSLRNVESSLAVGENLGVVFSGLSLGSILLLAALGLAITYGLMGVINMAHGEMMMIGAYATYVVQNLFRAHLPDYFQWYLAAAAPAAFIVAALVGVAIERTVIRFLYGRALETLLATWGVSLILMQAVRSLFGAQNVQVENPAWMSGRVFVTDNLELPYNRIVIIVFSVGVLLLVSYLLARTRLGLFVRAVTQNRGMARCVGVDSSRIDTMAFALGSGLAGLAGVALSQVGNVGPDLGQHYIVDSFMVVVLGGVGQLAGAVYAALGLGVAGKILENMSGAVLAEIALLIFIVVFIQKRPQGLFALGGRQAD